MIFAPEGIPAPGDVGFAVAEDPPIITDCSFKRAVRSDASAAAFFTDFSAAFCAKFCLAILVKLLSALNLFATASFAATLCACFCALSSFAS